MKSKTKIEEQLKKKKSPELVKTIIEAKKTIGFNVSPAIKDPNKIKILIASKIRLIIAPLLLFPHMQMYEIKEKQIEITIIKLDN